MKITVVFTGIGRAIAGENEVMLELPEGTTYTGVVQVLAERFPALKGLFISEDGGELLNANVFVNGEETIQPGGMEQSPRGGDRLTLLSIIVGG